MADDRDGIIDRLRTAVEEHKLPRSVRDLLEERLPADDFQTEADEIRERADEVRSEAEELEGKADRIEARADHLTAVAEAIGEAIDGVDAWEEAEGRDEKSDARDALIDALSTIVDAYDDAQSEADDDDSYDSFSPEVKAMLAEAESLAHAAVGEWLNRHFDEIAATLVPREDLPRAILDQELRSLIQDHDYRGDYHKES